MASRPSVLHWPALILFLFIAISITLLAGVAAIMALAGIVQLFNYHDNETGTTLLIMAVSMILSSLLLALAGYQALRRTSGHETAEQAVKLTLSSWHIRLALIIWPASIILGQLVINQTDFAWSLLPALNMLAVGIPVWLLVGLGSGGIVLGPRWRAWGIFGLGLTLGPFLIFAAETLLFASLCALGAIYIALNPGLLQTINALAVRLMYAPSEQAVLRALTPYIFRPATIFAVFASVSALIPIIEELLKPIGVWLFAEDIRTPAEGFALGVLSGAGYALFESLGASAQAGSTWGALLAARLGTSLLHVLTSGLMGWALVLAWRERRFLRLAAVYLLAISMHGLWNALSVTMTLATVVKFAAVPGAYQQMTWIAPIGLATLTIGMIIVLRACNRRLRKSTAASEPAKEAL